VPEVRQPDALERLEIRLPVLREDVVRAAAMTTLKPPPPVLLRHLATSTAVYRLEVEKVLSLLEAGLQVAPETMIPYLPLVDHLRMLLGAFDVGTGRSSGLSASPGRIPGMTVVYLPDRFDASRVMREARASTGLDLAEWARRLNALLGCTIIGLGMLSSWEAGVAVPPRVVLAAAEELESEARG
jgi:hypothetical protein